MACADVQLERAESLARLAPGATAAQDWRRVVARPDVDLVIVATTNDGLADVAGAAVAEGKHVLVEKPAARTVADIDRVAALAARTQRLVRVGFNHRYHPALRRARTLVNSGVLGDLLFLRARYGHGGRLGYDREWRADPARSGGGELIDQGVHVIDLARWFLGEFPHVTGRAHTYFWQMPVDDNAFLLLETATARTAFLHVSCTEWKNLFSLELYGRHAKLHVEGLGGSYGTERLALYRMLPEMGPPETTIWEFPQADDSWRLEFDEFLADIRLQRQPAASLADARAALVIIDHVYRQSGCRREPQPVGGAA